MAKTVLDQARPKAIRIALVVLRLRGIGSLILIVRITYRGASGSAREANP